MKEEQIIVGGQAVIEGVMMRAPHSYAVAVRKADGQIVSKGERLPVLSDKFPILKLPVLRGAAVLVHSMILGIKALNYSAAIAFDEADKADKSDLVEHEFELQAAAVTSGVVASAPVAVAAQVPGVAKGEQKAAKKTTTAAAIGSMVFALVFNVLLFIVLPLLLTNMLFAHLEGRTIGAASESGAWYAEAWAWLKGALSHVRH